MSRKAADQGGEPKASVTLDITEDLCLTIDAQGVYVSSAVKLSRQALADRIVRLMRREAKDHRERQDRLTVALGVVNARALRGDVL